MWCINIIYVKTIRNLKKGIDKWFLYAILKVQKENNLQKMLARDINTGVSYYEIQVAARAGQGSVNSKKIKFLSGSWADSL